MRIFAFITLLFMTTTAFSATAIKGIIYKGTIGLPGRGADYLITRDDSFPKQHYDIKDLLIERFADPIALKQGITIAKDAYNMIDNQGSLDLVSYDKKSGYYKYRLSLNTKQLDHLSTAPNSYKPIPMDRKILLGVNRSPEIFIEGRVIFVDNNPIMNNKNINNSCFELSFVKPDHNSLLLTATCDIPVTIYPE